MNMMCDNGYGVYSIVTLLLFWTLLAAAIAALLTWIKKNK